MDFGAGNPKGDELFDNVVRIDFAHYKANDIVSTEYNIPFKDSCFDFVISESVFEHVRDPWHYAQELYRILKKDGIIIVDTAFMQPVHSDPYHFYNMTLTGLEETFKMFKKIKSGVDVHQTAGFTMNILYKYLLSLVDNNKMRKKLKKKFGDLDFTRYDQYIQEDKRHIMSAGVFFIGKK